MKIFWLFACLLLMTLSVSARAWDDGKDGYGHDPWSSSAYDSEYDDPYDQRYDSDERRGQHPLYESDDAPREEPRRALSYDNPFEKSKERGPWHEKPVRKEDRVRTYARRAKEEDDPYYGYRTRHNNSLSDSVLRQLDVVR